MSKTLCFTFAVTMLFTSLPSQAETVTDTETKQRLQEQDKTGLAPKEPALTSNENRNLNQAASTANDDVKVAAINAEKLYRAGCMACHISGAARAPRLGVASDWSQRLKKGRETLIQNTINGIGAMPPRGGFGYSDEEITAIVDYMIEKSK